MQEPQYRSPGVRELLDAVAKAKRALHVDHEHAAAALPRAHPGRRRQGDPSLLHRCRRCGTSFDPKLHDAVQPRPAGVPPAGGEGQRAAGAAADQLQVGALRLRRAHRDPARAWRPTSRPRASTRRDDRAAGEAQGARLGVRAAREVGDAARGQLPLRAPRRHPPDQGGGALRPRGLARDVQLGGEAVRLARRRTRRTWCRSRSTPPRRKRSRSPSSAARALDAGAPNIERVDRLVQTIAAQKGMRSADARRDRRAGRREARS